MFPEILEGACRPQPVGPYHLPTQTPLLEYRPNLAITYSLGSKRLKQEGISPAGIVVPLLKTTVSLNRLGPALSK